MFFLYKKNTYSIDVYKRQDGILPEIKLNRDIVMIDDLQQFQKNEDLQKLNELIRDNPQKKFVLLSRGVAPGVFRAFQYTCLLYTSSPHMFYDVSQK